MDTEPSLRSNAKGRLPPSQLALQPKSMAQAEEDCYTDTARAREEENESPAETDLKAQLQTFQAQGLFELPQR